VAVRRANEVKMTERMIFDAALNVRRLRQSIATVDNLVSLRIAPNIARTDAGLLVAEAGQGARRANALADLSSLFNPHRDACQPVASATRR
jgi:hypothetical protein